MKHIYKKITLISLSILTFSFGFAQEAMSDNKARTFRTDTVASENLEKTYKVYEKGELIKNSVKVTTTQTQKIQLEGEDKGQVNQDRVIPKKTIYKTVKIDLDQDEEYDEMIRFSYNADVKSDFVLLLNENELYVAVGEGENLMITDNTDLSKAALNEGKEVFIFTDNEGNRVSFKIEEYQIM
ncbi:hypothetical protein [Muriicola soli]|uniref:Uncharacterized protein n=1 Tax=Muriicola soli TaxID=2507538 RepID=A0A411E9F5_9FLAO|nr:hypothetical protein [Muriicola soli]QBA64197.1 hypothetical protein EQY75_06450 [Muriicola soli]